MSIKGYEMNSRNWPKKYKFTVIYFDKKYKHRGFIFHPLVFFFPTFIPTGLQPCRRLKFCHNDFLNIILNKALSKTFEFSLESVISFIIICFHFMVSFLSSFHNPWSTLETTVYVLDDFDYSLAIRNKLVAAPLLHLLWLSWWTMVYYSWDGCWDAAASLSSKW